MGGGGDLKSRQGGWRRKGRTRGLWELQKGGGGYKGKGRRLRKGPKGAGGQEEGRARGLQREGGAREAPPGLQGRGGSSPRRWLSEAPRPKGSRGEQRPRVAQ